ncbi:long-chain-fatty-acid--coa ligase [Holotrichia oblita]|uniref:Long-chain-fatty-acid--coa ligase n=1 Tax=Holotrichia oblita TaxID=644536 RepID=A0ACB9TXW0_HOLOL|nr:long-chain-fatty-acid--coa ligase [Holotrichia oblita]
MAMDTHRINNLLYGPKRNIHIEKKGIGREIYDRMQEFKNRIMQIDSRTKEQETYADIHRKLRRIALEMRKRGVKPGDIILSCSFNSMDTILPIYSTLYLNAVTVTLDPTISLRDSTHLIKLVSPKIIFVIPEAVALVETAIVDLEPKPEIVVMGPSKKYATLSDFLKPHPEEEIFVPDDVNDVHDVSNIFFSSGTTGLPKAIMHTSYSMLTSIQLLREADFDSTICLYYTSFYWISAFLFTTLAILSGGTRIFDGEFTTETFLKALEEYKVTSTFLSPTLAMQLTAENTKNYKVDSLKYLFTGGSTVTETLVNNLRKYLPNTHITVGYGQTESGGPAVIFSKSNDSLFRKKPTSCGLPYANTILKIVDLKTGKALGPMERGEIRIKSGACFRGYIDAKNTPEDPFDSDGFVKSGDIGYYDEDNCLYFCDRLKEMFKYRSWHVVPASIELIIYEHPAVLETVVIGIPHEIDDHHSLALVVLRQGHNVTEQELLAFVNERVSDREKLRAGLRIVKVFPKTPTGKLARPMIREIAFSGNLQQLCN